jgi:hypothetical protein
MHFSCKDIFRLCEHSIISNDLTMNEKILLVDLEKRKYFVTIAIYSACNIRCMHANLFHMTFVYVWRLETP